MATADEPDLSHRQATLTLTVRDSSGVIVPDAEVHVELINPSFRWGTLQSSPPFRPGSDAPIRAAIERHHNSVTFGNDLKWGSFESLTVEEIRRRVRFMSLVPAFGVSEPFRQRGHTAIWSEQAPSDINSSSDFGYLQGRIRGHLEAYFEVLSPYIDNYDLYNEPGNARSLIGKMFPGSFYPNVSAAEVEEIADWFRRAAELQPGAQLFINEYNILNDWNGNDSRVHAYKAFIDRVRDAGGPVGGIGLQGHLDRRVTYEQFVRRIAIMAAPMPPTANHPEGLPGLPIEITELDINPNVVSDAEEAVMIDAALRAAFENPAVQGVSNSGIWDGSHWRRNGVIYDVDWQVKPSGQAWIDRVQNAYWTSETTRSDAEGRVMATVFKGKYRVAVRAGGFARSYQLDVSSDLTTDLVLTSPVSANTYAEWLDHQFFTDIEEIRQRGRPAGAKYERFAHYLFGLDAAEDLEGAAAGSSLLQIEPAGDGESLVMTFQIRASEVNSINTAVSFSDRFPFAVWSALTRVETSTEPILWGDEAFFRYRLEFSVPTRNTFYHLKWYPDLPEVE